MDEELLRTLRALTDAPRLRVVGVLAAGRPMTLDEVARGAGSTLPSAAHHLKRLRAAGLVAVTSGEGTADARYSLLVERLNEAGRALDAVAREAGQRGEERDDSFADASGEDARVLRSFFDAERLVSIPAQEKKRLPVLRYLARSVFEPDRDYPEKEVNQLLGLRHRDVASLRRYLVDYGFTSRDASVYRLRPESEWPS